MSIYLSTFYIYNIYRNTEQFWLGAFSSEVDSNVCKSGAMSFKDEIFSKISICPLFYKEVSEDFD